MLAFFFQTISEKPEPYVVLGYNTLGRYRPAGEDIDMLRYNLKQEHIRTHLKK